MFKLEAKDWPYILTINGCVKEPYIASGQAWPEQQLWSSLMHAQIYTCDFALNLNSFFVIRKNTVALEIDFLKTQKGFEGQGFMSCNFRHLKILSQALSLPLWLEVSEKNIKARSFYEHQGLQSVGFRRNYYKNGENALTYSYFV